MQRCYIDVGDVHRHLCYAILVDVPANGLGTLQCAGLHYRGAVGIEQFFACYRIALAHRAALLSNVKGNGVGASCGCAVEVEVHGNEEVSCSNNGASRSCHLLVEWSASKVGCLGIVVYALGNALIFALAANGKVLALRLKGCSLVAVARNVKLVGNALGKVARNLGTLLKRYAADRNNRQNVCGAYTWMGTMMLTHIYKLCSLCHSLKSSLHNVVGFAYKRNHRAVGGFSRVDVKQFYTLNALYFIRYLADNVQIAALAEVRHTLYYLLSFCHSVRYNVSSKYV